MIINIFPHLFYHIEHVIFFNPTNFTKFDQLQKVHSLNKQLDSFTKN